MSFMLHVCHLVTVTCLIVLIVAFAEKLVRVVCTVYSIEKMERNDEPHQALKLLLHPWEHMRSIVLQQPSLSSRNTLQQLH